MNPASDYQIQKYYIPLEETFTLGLKKSAKFLDAFIQDGEIQSWWLVPIGEELQERVFSIFGTGTILSPELLRSIKYLKTIPENEYFIWHLFEGKQT